MRRYFEHHYADKFINLDERYKFFDKHKIWEKKENPNSLISTKDTDFMIKSLPSK